MVEAKEGVGSAVQRDDRASELEEVLVGLRAPDKRIASKYHYDVCGSELFEQITRLEEYYPTRIETHLLRTWMLRWVSDLRPATLLELGAGNAEKTRIILDAMARSGPAETYVPVDVSSAFLQETARRLSTEYTALEVIPAIADITSPIPVPPDLPGPKWIAFLGSTLGNFEDEDAIGLLTHVSDVMGPGDEFLLGVDLRPGPHKSVERIELAYNDLEGVTATFALNVLQVLNDRFGSDFDVGAFKHRAEYDAESGRVETHLDSLRDQSVTFAGGAVIEIMADEAVRTEVSRKYDRTTIDRLFHESGLGVDRWVEDDLGFYALILGSTRATAFGT